MYVEGKEMKRINWFGVLAIILTMLFANSAGATNEPQSEDGTTATSQADQLHVENSQL